MTGLLRELLSRQRTLALYGLLLLALTPLALVAQHFDPRMLGDVNVWVKPAKFLVSAGLYAVTLAWFFGLVAPERRARPGLRWLVAVVVFTASFEVLYIAFQAAQGLPSHFNVQTPFHRTMYQLMGFFAVLLVGTSLPLAHEIARHPARGVRPDVIAATVIGLTLTFLLGGVIGGYLGSRTGHDVGSAGGHVPLFGWNRSGGDLRVAHFFGIHAQQMIPLLAWAIGAARERIRWAVVIAGSVAYAAFTIAVFVQALQGKALLPLAVAVP
jgi:hypothetical protein